MKLTNDEIKSISMFEQLTGAMALDCVFSDAGVVFVVKEGEIGRAIGKNGASINRVRTAFGRPVNVVENASELSAFVTNIFSSIDVKVEMRKTGEKSLAIVRVDAKDRGNAIGRNGERIKMARMLVERHFGADIKLLTEG
ncbi:MAG: NusA-like transcription termination signal-binding factor [Candidatus Micrarchaeota archaeon]